MGGNMKKNTMLQAVLPLQDEILAKECIHTILKQFSLIFKQLIIYKSEFKQ